jgi:hypothetical protein
VDHLSNAAGESGILRAGVERKRSKANEEAWHRTRRPEICMSKGAQRVDSYYPYASST